MNDLRVVAQRRIFTDRIDIHAWTIGYIDQGLKRTRLVAPPAEFVAVGDSDDIPVVLSLEQEQAQRLMDELWRCGLRPAEGQGSAGSLAATQKHLEDMRAIAFSVTKVTKP